MNRVNQISFNFFRFYSRHFNFPYISDILIRSSREAAIDYPYCVLISPTSFPMNTNTTLMNSMVFKKVWPKYTKTWSY